MEDANRIAQALEAWTTDLLPTITTLANQDVEDETLEVNIRDYNNVLHLFFVPNIANVIQPYLDEPQFSPAPSCVPLLQRISAGSEPDSLSSDNPIEFVDNLDHPGDGWEKFDAADTSHYPLVFINERGEAETAAYISYQVQGDETRHLRCRKKGLPIYSRPLHA